MGGSGKEQVLFKRVVLKPKSLRGCKRGVTFTSKVNLW